MKQCKLIIKDEVNVKFEGLDLNERKTLVKMFEYEDPAARYKPAYKLGRWNGKTSYFSLGGATYTNLLGEILPVLEATGYDIDLEDLRNYKINFDFKQVNENLFANYNWPSGHPKAGEPITLRDYQVEVINNFLSNPQSLQEIATGAGKTITTAALSYSVQEYGRSIVIVPNKSLVVQTEEDYRNVGLDVGVYFGDRKELGHGHTICTWQSLLNLLKDTQSGTVEYTIHDFIDDVVCVIVDECFDGDELVLTPKGYVPIRQLVTGDKVINYSEELKIFKEDTIVKQHVNLVNSMTEQMYELTFDNGETIKVTGNHKFLTNLGWCRADELTEEHEIVNYDINTHC
jgi:hypothetical protein